MWQTKYASAVPKNLGLGLNFRSCSEDYFLSGHPWSVGRNNDLINSFWNLLTFKHSHLGKWKKKEYKKFVKLLRLEPICIVGASTRRKCILFLNPVKSLSILSSLAATKLPICRKWMTLHTIYSMVVKIPAANMLDFAVLFIVRILVLPEIHQVKVS